MQLQLFVFNIEQSAFLKGAPAMKDYEINDPKTKEIMEASVEASDEDVQRMHKEGMEVVMYVKDEEVK